MVNSREAQSYSSHCWDLFLYTLDFPLCLNFLLSDTNCDCGKPTQSSMRLETHAIILPRDNWLSNVNMHTWHSASHRVGTERNKICTIIIYWPHRLLCPSCPRIHFRYQGAKMENLSGRKNYEKLFLFLFQGPFLFPYLPISYPLLSFSLLSVLTNRTL